MSCAAWRFGNVLAQQTLGADQRYAANVEMLTDFHPVWSKNSNDSMT